MKTALFAAAAMIAMPALAQTTPSSTPMPQDQSAMPAQSPAASSSMTTTQDQSAMSAPQGAMPAPQGQSTMQPPMSTSTTSDPNAPSAGAPVTTNGSGQMSMQGDNLPWCRPGQYNACREHENGKGQGVHRAQKMNKSSKMSKSSTTPSSNM